MHIPEQHSQTDPAMAVEGTYAALVNFVAPSLPAMQGEEGAARLVLSMWLSRPGHSPWALEPTGQAGLN